MNFENTLDFAKRLDDEDLLKNFRDKFFIPQHNGRTVFILQGIHWGFNQKRFVNMFRKNWMIGQIWE